VTEIKKPARRPAWKDIQKTDYILQPYFFSGAAGAIGAAGAAASAGFMGSAVGAAAGAGAVAGATGFGAGAFFSHAATAVMANSAASRIEYFFI